MWCNPNLEDLERRASLRLLRFRQSFAECLSCACHLPASVKHIPRLRAICFPQSFDSRLTHQIHMRSNYGRQCQKFAGDTFPDHEIAIEEATLPMTEHESSWSVDLVRSLSVAGKDSCLRD